MRNCVDLKNNMAQWRFELPEETERKLEMAGKILALKRAIKLGMSRREAEASKRDLERLERRLRFL